ncbi:hypothetical protein D3C85_1076990 [compost metagenome]
MHAVSQPEFPGALRIGAAFGAAGHGQRHGLRHLGQRRQHGVQVLARRAQVAREQQQRHARRQPEARAADLARGELGGVHPVRDHLDAIHRHAGRPQLRDDARRHRHHGPRAAERHALQPGVEPRIDPLIERVRATAQAVRVVTGMEPAVVHEVRRVHIGMGPGDEAVHVNDVELAAVPRQPPATRHGESLVAQQRRWQPRLGHGVPAHARMLAPHRRHLAGHERHLAARRQRRRHDLVVHAALPVVAVHHVRDDGDTQRRHGRRRVGGCGRHGVAPPDAASMRA